ncbi:MAG: hypothetical protein DWQ34_17915 [Planctomycetota bacterium]|nr:MAG: hypothetical protein DWQ34_17915 [Planctomycetota bacterium]
MRNRLPVLILFLVCTGCGDHRQADSVRPAGESAAAEQSWGEQVAAVRQGRSRQIIVKRQMITASEWADLREDCESLHVLEVGNAEGLAPADLRVLAGLPELSRLKLVAPIDDAGMEQIAPVKSLTVLNLPAAEFSDAGLAHAAQLPRLELLRFHSPHVTDAGLEHVSRMTSLRFLHLIDVPVTDAGITHLHRMTWLESFYLDGGDCTDEGLSALLTALPDLHFHKDQLHLPGDPLAHPHD